MTDATLRGNGRALGVGAWIAALVAAGLIVIVTTYRDYGITWDESVQAEYGDLVVAYFASGFHDTRANDFLNLKYYAPLADLSGSLVADWTDADRPFEARHFFLAITGLAAVVGVVLYTHRLAGLYGAIAASLALSTLPRFFGSAFNNPKDIPFACAFTWAMLATVGWLSAPRSRRSRVVLVGVAVGLALGVRPGALPLLVALIGAGVVLRLVSQRGAGRHASDRISPVRLVVESLVVVAIAWALMIAPWPWAHAAPLANPIAAIREAADFSSTFEVRFDGATYRSDRLPRTYLPKYLLITTPPLVLVLAALGLLVSPREASGRGRFALALARLWLLVPLAAVVVLRPNLYDGYRHFLFLLPAIAILAGAGAVVAVERLPLPGNGAIAQAVVALLLLVPVAALYRLHPYASAYFNGLVGGVGGASGRYETEYWASSYKEAIEWIDAEATRAGRNVRVLVAANRFNRLCAAAYLGENVRMRTIWAYVLPGARLPKRYDYYVSTTRYGYDANFSETPIVHVVGREGAPFTVIRANGAAR